MWFSYVDWDCSTSSNIFSYGLLRLYVLPRFIPSIKVNFFLRHMIYISGGDLNFFPSVVLVSKLFFENRLWNSLSHFYTLVDSQVDLPVWFQSHGVYESRLQYSTPHLTSLWVLQIFEREHPTFKSHVNIFFEFEGFFMLLPTCLQLNMK